MALESENLGKMDAVDILSVLKRIENLEKMAQGGGAKSKKQATKHALLATSGSGSGGSIPVSEQTVDQQ